MDLNRLYELTKNLEKSRTISEGEHQLLTIEDYKQWLDWVKKRIQALDRIEEKLHQMRQLAELVKKDKLNATQLTIANNRFKALEQEVQTIEEESSGLHFSDNSCYTN